MFYYWVFYIILRQMYWQGILFLSLLFVFKTLNKEMEKTCDLFVFLSSNITLLLNAEIIS